MPDFSSNFVGPVVNLRARSPAIPTTESLMNAFASSVVRWASVFDAAYQLDISSSSAADAAAGTGARTIDVYGLDKDFILLKETVTLNGQTKVTTVGSFRRVFEIVVATAGTGNANAGDIYIVKAGTGGTYTAGVPGTLTSAVIKGLAGDNYGLSGLWTAPRGTTYTLAALALSARAQSGTVKLQHGYPTDNGLVYPRYKIDFAPANPTFAPIPAPVLVIREKEDVYFTALCATAGGLASVEAVFIKQGS